MTDRAQLLALLIDLYPWLLAASAVGLLYQAIRWTERQAK